MSTLGQYRVGIDFNPSNDPHVTQFKNAGASWIDYLEQMEARDDLPPESKRLIRIAQRYVETAAMYSVKAVTKKPRT